MFRKYGLPILAVLGVLLALLVVFLSERKNPEAPIPFPPAKSPYPQAIAGSGIIEASSQNISVGSPFNEVINEIYVVEGDFVKKGDPILQLDLRAFNAAKEVAAAQIKVAEANLESAKKQLSFYRRLKDSRAASEQACVQAYYTFVQAEQNLQVAQSNLQTAQVNIERATIRAPVDGQILMVNAHVGEIAPITPFIQPAATWKTAAYGTMVLMGTVCPLQVRIDIDEEDSWRYKKGASATAFVRGNSNICFPLKFFRLEPYIVPKSSFTGSNIERVDTRVLQVLYVFDDPNVPVYAGQVVDVFIESEPLPET